MAKNKCVDQVVKHLKDKGVRVTKAEADAVLDAVERRMKRYGDSMGPMDPRWQKAAEEVLTDVKIAAYVQRRNAKLNKIKQVELRKLAADAVKAGVKEYFRSIHQTSDGAEVTR